MLNLLSEHIINADGTPGPNFAKAHQFQIVSVPNGYVLSPRYLFRSAGQAGGYIC